MADTSSIFTGSSRYSKDFQTVIDRAVAIASLGLSQLESSRSVLNEQQTALQSLNGKVAALQNAVASLNTASTNGSYESSVSNASAAKVSLSGSVLPGTYQLEVVGLGSYSTTLSKDSLPKVTDPKTQTITLQSSLTLTVDGVSHIIEPASVNLAALAEAINAKTEAGVQATIVNVGPDGSPDYRLSLASSKLGAVTISLDDTGGLLDTLSTGAKAQYRVGGLATTLESTDRNIELAPGIAAEMTATGSTTVSVKQSTTGISGALSTFASAYNAVVDEMDKHRGKTGGALSGQVLLSSLSDSMRQLTGFSSAGKVASLAGLGLSFSDQGKLSLNSSDFSKLPVAELQGFLGGAESGGFIGWATDLLDGLENSTDGLITTAQNQLSARMTAEDKRISSEQDRIDALRESLFHQFAAADALIASLEQQVLYITGLFESYTSNQR